MAGPPDKLTYGGIPLLFDRERQAQDFLDRNQPLEELALAGPPVGALGSRTGSYGQTRQIGLPLANYPPYPKPRVNELYWPTGAARWAIGYFLVDTAGLAKISALQSQSQSGTLQPLTLKANDGTTSMQWTMYELTRVPITCPTGGNNLWLLVLTDERWYWQTVSAGAEPAIASWDGLVTDLIDQIETTHTQDIVEAAYLIPDVDEMMRRFDNAALLLDAAAFCCGQRVVRQFDGTVRVENAAGAEAQHQLNMVGPFRLAAGGDMPAQAPFALAVVFPRLVGCCWNGEYHRIEKLADDLAPAGIVQTDFARTMHDTAWANGESGTPTNNTRLDALAEQIATDFYAWHKRRYDRTFIGLQVWQLTGYDDAVTFSFGQELEATPRAISTLDGEDVHTAIERQFVPRYFTRVRSLPLNFGVDQLCHQDDDLDLPERPPGCEHRIGSFNGTLSPGGSITVQEIGYDESDEQVYTGRTFTAWDFFANSDGEVTGEFRVKADWICDRYVIMEMACAEADNLPEA